MLDCSLLNYNVNKIAYIKFSNLRNIFSAIAVQKRATSICSILCKDSLFFRNWCKNFDLRLF